MYEVIYNNKCCLWGNFVLSNACQKWYLETHLYLKPYATTDWCFNYFLPCKEFIRSHRICGFLKHRKIQTENQVNPVVVNCWMKNWNGGFVMCALVHNESRHSPEKTQFVLVNLLYFFCITHSLILPLDSVNRANFWDPTKSLYFNPEWSTTRLVNQNPKTHKIYLLLLRKQFLYCNLYMPKKGHGKTFFQAVRKKTSDNKVILKVFLCLVPSLTL
jgi:hypothetical protein